MAQNHDMLFHFWNDNQSSVTEMITYFDPCLMKVNAMIFYSKNIDLAEENVMKQADSLFVQQYSYVSDVHAHVPQAQIQMDSFSLQKHSVYQQINFDNG